MISPLFVRLSALLIAMTATAIGTLPAQPTPGSGGQEGPAPGALPAPTGKYPVGTAVFLLRDATRKDTTAAPRTFLVQVWYPCEAGKSGSVVAPYLPEPGLATVMKQEEYNDLPPAILEGWQKVQTHAKLGAPVIAAPHRLPLLVFSPGFGMSRVNYTALMEDLASHGYLIAAIDHPYTGLSVLPDGKVLALPPPKPGNDPEVVNGQRLDEMARDASYTLDCLTDPKQEIGRFTDRIDPKRIGTFGHSLGGAEAIRMCQRDARFAACADLDGDLWGKMSEEGVGRPLLVLLNEPPESRRPPAAMQAQRDKGWADFIARKTTAAFVVKVSGTSHFSFTDFPFVIPPALMAKTGAEIAPGRGHEIITSILRAFFGQNLGGGVGAAVPAVAVAYPEVSVKAFVR